MARRVGTLTPGRVASLTETDRSLVLRAIRQLGEREGGALLTVRREDDTTWFHLPATWWSTLDELTRAWLARVQATWRSVYGGDLPENSTHALVEPLVAEHGVD